MNSNPSVGFCSSTPANSCAQLNPSIPRYGYRVSQAIGPLAYLDCEFTLGAANSSDDGTLNYRPIIGAWNRILDYVYRHTLHLLC
jgi:hypothetical protein